MTNPPPKLAEPTITVMTVSIETMKAIQQAVGATSHEPADILQRVRRLHEFINYLQSLGTSAEGNIRKMNKEMQNYLRDGSLPE
jgi:hypothetical protein